MKSRPVELLELAPRTAAEARRAVKPDYVVLTSGGKPVAYVLSAEIYDEEDIGYMTDPEFWKMIRERRKGTNSVSWDEVKAELLADEGTERTRRKPTGNGKSTGTGRGARRGKVRNGTARN